MSQIRSQDDEPFGGDGDYESLPPHVSVATHMTAGAVAGILEHTVMYPVDSVKVTHTEAHKSRLSCLYGSSTNQLPNTANCTHSSLSAANEG